MSRISRLVTTTIRLGENGIGDQLQIAPSGDIAPSAYRVAGVVSDVAGAVIVNDGTIRAGFGGYYYGFRNYPTNLSGASGVDLTAPATLHNTGTIIGGDAGFVTFGMIFLPNYAIGPGGAGVFSTSALALTNGGTIAGGGGVDVDYGPAGAGGGGVVAGAASYVTNRGVILGGGAGYQGTERPAPGTAGTGGTGVDLGSGSTLHNSGSITGGFGGYTFEDAGTGGAGVNGVNLTVLNQGLIAGGGGGESNYYASGQGGAGIYARSAIGITNRGTIVGGQGGLPNGVDYVAAGGGGGIGVNLEQGGLLNNTGLISGGAGGGATRNYIPAGRGGIGVELTPGGNGFNHGTITGGAGGYHVGPGDFGGAGGVGVLLDGGTFTNWGTIAGGQTPMQPGFSGDAVLFGSGVATLVVEPGAVFDGRVVGNEAVDDTLALSGTTPGTLSALGSQFTGFTTVSESAGANWTFAGPNALGARATLEVGGTLRDIQAPSGAGLLSAGTVELESGATLQTQALDVSALVFTTGGSETFATGSAADVAGVISGFGAGDRIDLTQASFNQVNFANGTLSLLSGSILAGTLMLQGDYATADFKAVTLPNNGTIIEFVAPTTDSVTLSPADFAWGDAADAPIMARLATVPAGSHTVPLAGQDRSDWAIWASAPGHHGGE